MFFKNSGKSACKLWGFTRHFKNVGKNAWFLYRKNLKYPVKIQRIDVKRDVLVKSGRRLKNTLYHTSILKIPKSDK